MAPNFDWSSIQRVVLMPLGNRSAYPHVAEELQSNLAAELQRAGRFEIAGPPVRALLVGGADHGGRGAIRKPGPGDPLPLQGRSVTVLAAD